MKAITKDGAEAGRAVLLLGHGSAMDEANDIVRLTAKALQDMHRFGVVEPAFLMIAEPGFQGALEALLERGYRDITVMPYFLSSGAHVVKDIPDAIDLARKKYPDIKMRITKDLGFHENIIDVVAQRLTEALREER